MTMCPTAAAAAATATTAADGHPPRRFRAVATLVAAVVLAGTATAAAAAVPPPPAATAAVRAAAPPLSLTPAEVAKLPRLHAVWTTADEPPRLLAAADDGRRCALSNDWSDQPLVATTHVVAGLADGYAVAIAGRQICSCALARTLTAAAGTCRSLDGEGRRRRACFPAAATVTMAGGGGVVRMDALALGDELCVAAVAGGRGGGGAPRSSTLWGWSHRDAGAVTEFVALTYVVQGAGPTTGAAAAAAANASVAAAAAAPRTLHASPGHYLYRSGATGGGLVAAANVVVGDTLAAADGAGGTADATVTAVGETMDVGLYNPHTAAGELIVDGLRVSAYTTALPPVVAAVALAPVRAAAAVGVVDPLGRLWPAVEAAAAAAAWVEG